jgi:ATP-dependent Clp protease ATP-binding subunit ClpA
MASSPGPTAADRAGDVARRLEQSWIGPEHVLLALFDEPSVAAEALEELGVSRERSRRTPGAAAGATRPATL